MATRTTTIASVLHAPVFAGSQGWSLANFARKLLSALKIIHESFVEAQAMADAAQKRYHFIGE